MHMAFVSDHGHEFHSLIFCDFSRVGSQGFVFPRKILDLVNVFFSFPLSGRKIMEKSPLDEWNLFPIIVAHSKSMIFFGCLIFLMNADRIHR